MVDNTDRRKAARCPICQGPAFIFDDKPEEIRCRNSLCIQNHTAKKCPRCGSESIGDVRRKKDSASHQYTCADCEHVWE